MPILVLDTSSARISLALFGEGPDPHETFFAEGRDHVAQLTPAVKKLLTGNHVEVSDLDLLVVGTGPGSFVGTRLAKACAEALALVGQKPLEEVSSLLAYDFKTLHAQNHNKRCIVVVKSGPDRYNYIVVDGAHKFHPPQSSDIKESAEAPFIKTLKNGDELRGPLTEQNWQHLLAAVNVKIRIVPEYPQAKFLVLNRPDLLNSLLKKGSTHGS